MSEKHTLNAVIDFGKDSLVNELNLMGDNIASSGCPVGLESIVASDPFTADVAVDGDGVRSPVISNCRKCHVGEGKGLAEKVIRLRVTRQYHVDKKPKRKTNHYWTEEVDSQINAACSHHEGALSRRILCRNSSAAGNIATASELTEKLFCVAWEKVAPDTAAAPRKLYEVPSTFTKPAQPKVCCRGEEISIGVNNSHSGH